MKIKTSPFWVIILLLVSLAIFSSQALAEPYGYDSGFGGRDSRDRYDDYDDRRDIERERRELDRERDRLEYERSRIEAERHREQPRYDPAPARVQERCPSGFSPSENKCSQEERRRGCKDMRLPGGLGCVKR